MRCCGSRRNASRVALDASTPDFPLTPSLNLRPQTRATRRTTDFRKVDVEIVADNGPVCGGSGAAEQVAEKPREILFRPGIANDAFDLASGDVESGDQGLSAVALIFELASLTLPGTNGSPGAMRSNA